VHKECSIVGDFTPDHAPGEGNLGGRKSQRPYSDQISVGYAQSMTEFAHRLATLEDVPALAVLMDQAIADLQQGFLSPDQIASSRMIMGLDTQLILDGGYFLVEDPTSGLVAGSGGWSRRATLYGGDHSPGRDAAWLDPNLDAARVRAMYTSPAFARRGVGRLVLSLCESAAAAAGFRRVELMGTLSGVPLYTACGYQPIERIEDARGGAPVPLLRMGKALMA
jgi:GNAT superfamily N-acetyltransferase